MRAQALDDDNVTNFNLFVPHFSTKILQSVKISQMGIQ